MYGNPYLYTDLTDFTGLEAIFFSRRTDRMLRRFAIDTLIFPLPIIALLTRL
jgi:hypothetical protein